MDLTFGSDPELIIVDMMNDPCSAIRVLGTDKNKPIDLGDSIRIYADNALIEAAFDPVEPGAIVERLGVVLKRMNSHLGGRFRVMAQAATMFSEKELKAIILNGEIKYATPKQLEALRQNPKVKQLVTAWEAGCNPNYDAYKEDPNPKAEFTDGLRTGSFHIHIGNADWKSGKDKRLLTLESKIEAVKLLDLYVGMTSLLFDEDETAPKRRKLYGKAGEFRPTPYGLEYRVLGNGPLRSRSSTQLVFDLVTKAMAHISAGTAQDVLKMIPEANVIHIINQHDTSAAEGMQEPLGIHNIMERYWKTRRPGW